MAIQRFTSTGWQAICVASLVAHCEAIAAAGLLPEPSEESLRLLIAETLCAFRMDHHQETAA